MEDGLARASEVEGCSPGAVEGELDQCGKRSQRWAGREYGCVCVTKEASEGRWGGGGGGQWRIGLKGGRWEEVGLI